MIEMETETLLATGLVERIGEEAGKVKNTFFTKTKYVVETVMEQPIPNHANAMMLALSLPMDKERGIFRNTDDMDAVGHRVAHGGEDFCTTTRITTDALEAIRRNIPLAPLHNPSDLEYIRMAMEIFSRAPQVAVFDTAFHQTMLPRAFLYALPYILYEQYGMRRYGFHGTSHSFVTSKCARMLEKPLAECNMILGSGCSMTAIENGRSIDITLGMTSLGGLVMSTRSGDINPTLSLFLQKNKGMSIEQIDNLLHKESGLKGICKMSDMRDIYAAATAGDALAGLAIEIQTYRNRKYIGDYTAALGKVDSIVFTASIGENDAIVRSESLKGLEGMGVKLDAEKNEQQSKEARCTSHADSAVQVFVIPTNEELAIAREAASVMRS